MFRERIEFTYPTSFLVPGVGQDWNPGHEQVLVDLVSRLEERVPNLQRNYHFLRFYCVHQDSTFDQFHHEDLNERHHHVIDLRRPYWRDTLVRRLAVSMSGFTEKYDALDPAHGRDLARITVWIDLATNALAGGARPPNSKLPNWFPENMPEDCIFNPSGTLCFLKCIQKAKVIQRLEDGRARLGDTDKMTYPFLAMRFAQAYPQWSLRLCNRFLWIMQRNDGAEYADLSNVEKRKKILFIMLDSEHYYYVRKPDKAVKYLRNNQQLALCFYCGEIHESQAECDHCTCEGNQGRRARLKLSRDDYEKTRRQPRTHCGGCGKKYLRADAANHVCYMEGKKLPEELSIEEWYAFDYEAMLIPVNEEVSLHQVNLVCVQKMFARPFERWTFKTLPEFIQWIRDELVPLKKKTAFIAHNLKGYDGRLTLTELFKGSEPVEDMIWDGSKIHCFSWLGCIHFRDSLLHIQQPLSAFPKIFGLQEMHKGWFPYKFNTPENQDYVGPLPPLDAYEPQFKSKKDRKELVKWHRENRNRLYVFQQELEKYCQSDVDILAQALEKYYEAGQQLNDEMLPPLEQLTAASYTLNCWKTLHYTEEKLAYHTLDQEKRAREALKGGRTDVRQMYKKWSMEDVMERGVYGKYVDVQSMYPFVMYTQPMPVGKPKVITKIEEWEYDQVLENAFGFVNVSLLSPKNYVHHPPFMTKRGVKLVATLEPTTITMTTVELKDALDCGWLIDKINWIQSYDQDRSLFKDYIRKLVTEKIHSSSGPPEDFEQLAEEWQRRYQVTLQRDKMEFNAGKRAIAKLQLNSLWGKLAERPHLDAQVYADGNRFMQLEQLELDGEIVFKNKLWLGPDRWFLDYKWIKRPIMRNGQRVAEANDYFLRENRRKTNVAIGSFVTMWGRRMLWEEMRRLGKRTVYHDTDSIVFEYREGEYNTPLGRCLGDWEDELPGKPIIEFVALAPKTYGYRYLDTPVDIPDDADDQWFQQFQPYELWEGKVYPVKECVKVKGFRLHSEAMESINFDGLLDLLRNEKVCLEAKQLVFNYKRDLGEITSKYMTKALVFDYEKGIIGANYVTYPFGSLQYTQDHQRCNLDVEEGDPRCTGLVRQRNPSHDENDDGLASEAEDHTDEEGLQNLLDCL